MRLDKFLNKRIKVWLDDERKAPSGWIQFKTVPGLISFYTVNSNNIIEMSLDHDLGEDTPTGYDFLSWLEEQIYYKKITHFPKTKVHSANPVGKRRMIQTIKSIEKMISKGI